MLGAHAEIARGTRRVNERKGSKVPPPLGADAVHKCRRADCHPPYWPDGPPPNRKIGAKKEKALQNEELIFFSGGDGGIRTLDASFSPHAPLAGGRISFICMTFKVFFCFFGTLMGHFGTDS